MCVFHSNLSSGGQKKGIISCEHNMGKARQECAAMEKKVWSEFCLVQASLTSKKSGKYS